MSRVIQAVMTADQRTDVVQRLDEVAGVVGVSVLIGASRTPAGDIVSVQVSNDAARAVLKQLDEAGVLSGGSAVLSEPTALIAPAGQEIIDRESNEAAWEEIAALLRRNTNVGTNFLVMRP